MLCGIALSWHGSAEMVLPGYLTDLTAMKEVARRHGEGLAVQGLPRDERLGTLPLRERSDQDNVWPEGVAVATDLLDAWALK